MRKLAGAVIGIALAAGVGAAQAQGVTPAKTEDAIKYRQATMFLMSQHVGAMAAMVRGDRPFDQAAFVSHAALVEELARLPWGAYQVAGSDKGQTRAKADIQTNRDKFEATAKKFMDDTSKLTAAAKTGDQGAIKTAFGAVGGNCKNCHENFRGQ